MYSYVLGRALEHGQAYHVLKTWLSFTQKASTVCSSPVRDGAHELRSTSMLECWLAWSCSGFVQAMVAAMNSWMEGFCYVQQTLFLAPDLPSILAFESFHPHPFCNGSEPWWKKIKMSQLWMKIPLTLILCILIHCQFLSKDSLDEVWELQCAVGRDLNS